MTVHELDKKLGDLIKTEREITNEILALINIGFEQRAYLDLGFSSMFDWLTRGFGYSNGAAQRRIEAARFLKAVPVVAEKLEKGDVTLSTVSRVQSVIKEHEKNLGTKVSSIEKLKVLEKVENKTIVETEQILVSLFPDVKSTVAQERRIVIDETTTRHSMNLSGEISSDLKRAKELLSHIFPKSSDAEVIGYALKFLLDKVDPLRRNIVLGKKLNSATDKVLRDELPTISEVKKAIRLADDFLPKKKMPIAAQPKDLAQLDFSQISFTTAAEVNRDEKSSALHEQVQKPFSRAANRRMTLMQSRGACMFKDPVTSRICNSRYQVQIDHIQPKAIGGTEHPENLRVLCRQHNLLMAERTFGKNKMDQFRKSL